ncbi:MAG: hypothetical protein ACLQBL_29100 [Polyangiaceae bacterium]
MPSCTLEIGGRIVARAEGGPFDAEYALFEAHEIELRSNNEPGTVREHGYGTTAELARERLEMEGVTQALAEATAGELGALATAYALGPEVRRVAALLTPTELFEGRVWQAAAKKYEGGWLDVAALAEDSGVNGAARAIQELYLATLLAEAPPDSTVYLTTTEFTAGRRPGERTHRRVSLANVGNMPEAIRALAERHEPRSPREAGPSRAELLHSIRRRLASGVLESSRASLEAIERALSVRDRPTRGPLTDPDLWALELQLSEGDASGAVEKLDALERSRGRQPGTAYLRARIALLLGTEEPRQIAERASSLAMSMSAFAELELLAAEAWMRAGDRKRALAYAHDLADNPQLDPGIRARARAIVEPTRQSIPAIEKPKSIVPPFTPVPPPLPASSQQGARSESSPIVAITAGLRGSVAPRSGSGELRRAPTTPGMSASVRNARIASSAPPMPTESGWEEPIAPTPIVSIGVGPISRSSASHRATPAPPSVPDDEEVGQVLVRGGSQPPFRTEPPPPNFPAAPLLPRLEPDRVEKAETLSLPEGLRERAGGSEDPKTPLEARIFFTHKTRELGRLYRERYNVELRTDLRSLELLQRHLAEHFEAGEIKSYDDVLELRLHGAFLSELLARRLGAEWTDLAVSEMGYWAMNVPPGTTVWPIGRVIRFVTMQHRERDLVSYFLELQVRASGV